MTKANKKGSGGIFLYILGFLLIHIFFIPHDEKRALFPICNLFLCFLLSFLLSFSVSFFPLFSCSYFGLLHFLSSLSHHS